MTMPAVYASIPVPERIAPGVNALDTLPPGTRGLDFHAIAYVIVDWRAKIRDDDIIMNNCARCVLGQLFWRYTDAPDHLRKNPKGCDFETKYEPSITNGFETRAKEPYSDLAAEWAFYLGQCRDARVALLGGLSPFDRWCVKSNLQHAETEGRDAIVARLRVNGYYKLAAAVEISTLDPAATLQREERTVP
jgi:hypothetical protein